MAGKIVKTKSGFGKTKNFDKPINGRIKVYLDNGKNILVHTLKITVLGFYD